MEMSIIMSRQIIDEGCKSNPAIKNWSIYHQGRVTLKAIIWAIFAGLIMISENWAKKAHNIQNGGPLNWMDIFLHFAVKSKNKIGSNFIKLAPIFKIPARALRPEIHV